MENYAICLLAPILMPFIIGWLFSLSEGDTEGFEEVK